MISLKKYTFEYQNSVSLLYVLHYHRKLLYFNISVIYIIYIHRERDIAKNPLRTFLGLNHEEKKNIKAWPKKKEFL